MSDPYNVPPAPEQDQSGAGDALPTYDDLAAQHGPNSRFGRWREWIEKRAAERYNDLSPADLERRRQRGWTLDQPPSAAPPEQTATPPTLSVYAPSAYTNTNASSSHPPSMYTSSQSSFMQMPPGQGPYPPNFSMYAPSAYTSTAFTSSSHPPSMYSSAPSSYNPMASFPMHPQLHLQTSFSEGIPISPLAHTRYPSPPASLIPESLEPSHLKMYNFGSRFLPHTTSPIRCLLPISNHRLLLIGHDDGLSVLDMFPRDSSPDDEEDEKGPSEAEAKLIWEGEGVHQMTILESESTGEGTPQGVVLALVSTEADSSKESENPRQLRMYNLASLVSLAKWTVTQKGARPLDMRCASPGKNSQNAGKRHHRPPSSITKGLKHLVLDNGIARPQETSSKHPEPHASYSSISSMWTSPTKGKAKAPVPTRADSVDSEWDVVNELPLRWATHYTPLASAGSRLQDNSVVAYDIFRNEGQRGPGGVFLAIVTKSSILLYEAPKGERAFRFSKEFYTPLPAKNVTFVHQSVSDSMSRSPSDIFPRTAALDAQSHRHTRVVSVGATSRSGYPTQLTLFVIFEKKAGTIRLADSAVGEVDLYEDNWSAQQATLAAAPSVSSLTSRRSRASWDGRAFMKDKGAWARPARFAVPSGGSARAPGSSPRTTTEMCAVTRGRQSHIVPHPLPAKLAALPPYRILYWTSAPAHVTVRVCEPGPDDDPETDPPFLQVVALGEDGVEVQEVPLAQLSERKGKGRAQEPIKAQADTGGTSGLLAPGGHWDQPFYPGLSRSYSTSSYSSYDSEATAGNGYYHGREGIYGWVQRGAEDWRVFWLGDANSSLDDDFDDEE